MHFNATIGIVSYLCTGRAIMLFKDEHISSFLYRTQKSFGSSDYSNIIPKKGGFGEHVRITTELMSYYSLLDDRDLFCMLSDHADIKKITTHEDLFHEVPTIKAFLNPRHGIFIENALQREIRFCPQCITENLSKFGVSYLKFEWFQNSICFKHGAPLSTIFTPNYKDTVDALDIVISGEIHPKAVRLKKEETENSQIHRRGSINKLESSALRFKPCMTHFYYEWVVRNRKNLSNHLYSLVK